ncbi:hypothetical protein C4B63_60g165 [Trypanosoma cruzi]|uniref:Kelch repeat-containing protein n=1 Tax=Trypanosoma cruzi TaxID=5693 RepID=A0A2V2V1I0_TRYCR|nr:hypothetical protein C4B63_60g165 [Trypanosoma cruzi]
MGKGRDKRKKHEDPLKAVKRASRQAQKRAKGIYKGDSGDDEVKGFNNEEAPEVTLNRIRKQEGKMRTTLVEENVPAPSPRANVVFTAHPERDHELMLFGGEYWDGEKTVAYNDLYFYNIKRDFWSRLVTALNPPPRSSSQGVLYKHFLLICGGEFVSQSQSQFLHFKDVWRFDTKKFEWEELKGLKGGPRHAVDIVFVSGAVMPSYLVDFMIMHRNATILMTFGYFRIWTGRESGRLSKPRHMVSCLTRAVDIQWLSGMTRSLSMGDSPVKSLIDLKSHKQPCTMTFGA